MTTRFRAQFDGRALIPLDPVDLPTGQVLEIEASEGALVGGELAPGSPQAILRAMAELPHITRADVDELERVIEASQLPVQYRGVFDEEAD